MRMSDLGLHELKILYYMQISLKVRFKTKDLPAVINRSPRTAFRYCQSLYEKDYLERLNDGARFLYNVKREKKKEIREFFSDPLIKEAMRLVFENKVDDIETFRQIMNDLSKESSHQLNLCNSISFDCH